MLTAECITSEGIMNTRLAERAEPVARAIYHGLIQFIGSSFFFILLGIGFLVAVVQLMDSTHPVFIFLLAILGVSIVLYGTGTHGVGSAEFKQVPVKVAVAGGAGVLAAVFGYGVAWMGKDIRAVFHAPQQYGRVVLSLAADPMTYQGDLRRLLITAVARTSGKPLHLFVQEDQIEVLVPISYFPDKAAVCVTATLPPDKPLTAKRFCPPLNWAKNDGSDGELVVQVGEGRLALAAPQANRVDEKNNPVRQDEVVLPDSEVFK
jgi:hypothetical protein